MVLRRTPDDSGVRRWHRSTMLGALAGWVVFLWVLWGGRFAPFRTANPHGYFSNFYDIQAQAFFRGHLDVPPGSLSIEAFVVGGRHYMYFPPFPAILRMPILALTDRFNGRLTAPYMLLAHLAITVAVIGLVSGIRRLLRGDAPVSRAEATITGLFVFAVVGGSALVYLAALPWVYHEAYLWAVAMVLFTLVALLRVLDGSGGAGTVVMAGLSTLAAVGSRSTDGWACVVALIIGAFWLRFAASCPGRRAGSKLWIGLLFAGLVPLAAGFAYNYVKFGNVYIFPLDKQVWTSVNASRRWALAVNGGGLDGTQFFLTNLRTYLNPAGIRTIPMFPWLTLPATPVRTDASLVYDQVYRTGGVPAFMPALFMLALWGIFCVARRRPRAQARTLMPVLLGALAVPAGIMFYGYLANRYTVEFVPPLVVGGAIGCVDIGARLAGRRPAVRRVAIVALGVLVAFGASANLAAATTAATLAEGGSRLARYVDRQSRFVTRDDHVVTTATSAPLVGTAEHFLIIGNCQAVLVATGEDVSPWTFAELHGMRISATVEPSDLTGSATATTDTASATVLNFSGGAASVAIQSNGTGWARLSATTAVGPIVSSWWRADGRPVDIDVDVDSSLEWYTVSGPGAFRMRLPTQSWNSDWYQVTALPAAVATDPDRQHVATSVEVPPASATCRRLQAALPLDEP